GVAADRGPRQRPEPAMGRGTRPLRARLPAGPDGRGVRAGHVAGLPETGPRRRQRRGGGPGAGDVRGRCLHGEVACLAAHPPGGGGPHRLTSTPWPSLRRTRRAGSRSPSCFPRWRGGILLGSPSPVVSISAENARPLVVLESSPCPKPR